MEHIYLRFQHLLDNFNLPFLQPRDLERYCQAIHNKGAALDHCFGFVDSNVRAVCRPGENQRVIITGTKKSTPLNFRLLLFQMGSSHICTVQLRENAMTLNCYKCQIFCQKLIQFARDTRGRLLCIYGDPAYHVNIHLQSPFRNVPLTPAQRSFNKSVSQQRVSVEWVFGDIISWWKFMEFKKNLKMYLSAVGKMFLTCALLTNARTCLYGNLTSEYFDCQPPTLENYFM